MINDMGKIERLLEISGSLNGLYINSIISAICATLTELEAETLLEIILFEKVDTRIRTNLIKRIQKLMPSSKIEDRVLLSINNSQKIPLGLVNNLGFIFFHLYPFLTDSTRSVVLDFLLNSRFEKLRNRAYKILHQDWQDSYIGVLQELLTQHKDPDCCKILISNASDDFLERNVLFIKTIVEGTWLIRKLGIRMAQIDRSYIDGLFANDDLSRVYVLAKTGFKIDHKEGLRLFRKHFLNHEVGLLIWSLGQMGLFDTIDAIAREEADLWLNAVQV